MSMISELEERLQKLQEVYEIQGKRGNWDANEYNRGYYNGIELSLAILENRLPEYK